MPHAVGAALLSLALSAAGTGATSEEIVVSLRPSGAVLVPVAINGRGPFTFLLDTGASHTVVSTRLATRLGLPIVAKTLVSTEAGDQARLVVELERLTIGSASVAGLLPTVVDLARLFETEPRLDGVVGQDFLSAFNYTLDFRRRRLRWTAANDDERVRLPLVRAGDRPLVQLAGDGNHGPVLMVPDSGSEVLVVFERSGRTALAVEYLGQRVGVSVVGSQDIGRGAIVRDLKVGNVTLRNQPVVVLTGRRSDGGEGDGLLPLHRFSSVAFNNTEGWMAVRK
jgi:hypothetical protein